MKWDKVKTKKGRFPGGLMERERQRGNLKERERSLTWLNDNVVFSLTVHNLVSITHTDNYVLKHARTAGWLLKATPNIA